MKIWQDTTQFIEHVYVDEGVVDYEYTQEILSRITCPYSILEKDVSPPQNEDFPRNVTQGKKTVYLTENKGNFFKPCPGTNEYRCCGYNVLSIGMNCAMDCVYCILQAYSSTPWITVYVNLQKMFDELDFVLSREKDRLFRIGTGEFTDSLTLERWTGISEKLIHFLSQYKNSVLELKTKSSYIDSLLDIQAKGNTILAWSLNSPVIVRKQEIRSSSLEDRLDSAAKAAACGYKLAFHFDPIVLHDDWQDGYLSTINLLFEKVPKEAIVWISLGGLRYLPSLKQIAIERFPHSSIFFQEFIPGLDKKIRYFRSQREELYTFLYNNIERRLHKNTCLYFCMESDEIWNSIAGFVPDEAGGISEMLDKAAYAVFDSY